MSKSHAFYKVKHVAIIVLAAGASTRMGQAKQTLLYKGKTLLQHAAAVACDSGLGPVCVVLGAHASLMAPLLKDLPCHWVMNPDYADGMAGSLQVGLRWVLENFPKTDGVIIMVCDQPYLKPSKLKNLFMKQHQSGLPIVASSYQYRMGTPALLAKPFFNELFQLKGDTGARPIFDAFPELVTSVPFKKGIFDIDTPRDYDTLLHS